jgi:hydrogenase nickel incorporation protein HypA/HybF
MHELSIAMSILDAAEEEAERNGGGVASAIHVRIGKQSGIVPGALLAAYELACENTSMAQCRLVIENVDGPDLLVTALELMP